MSAREESAATRPLPPDAEARREAVREFSRPLLVEAGAGTGKTSTLVARVVAWCLGPGWERHRAARSGERGDAEGLAAEVLRRVVAITFTELAAAEMSTRVAEAFAALAEGRPAPAGLEHAELPDDPAELRRRARAFAATSDRLTVQTIHSWCSGLLGAHPLEADLAPGFGIDAEGARREEAARRAIDAALGGLDEEGARSEEEGAAAMLRLARRGVRVHELVAALAALLEADIEPEALLGPSHGDEEARRVAALAAERARALLEGGLGEALAGAKRARKNGEIVGAIDRLVARAESEPPPPLPALLGELEALRNFAGSKLDKWAKSDLGRGELDALEPDQARRLPRVADELRRLLRALERVDLELLEDARRALAGPLGAAAAALRAQGVVGYDGLLVRAQRLLAERADIARARRREIDQLLVDEFQDTDAVQCELVRRLALDEELDADHATSGDEALTRPGLFVVGDPKQSIYLFRGADLLAYDEFAEALEAAGGRRLALTCNFRSRPEILERVGEVVAPHMRRERGVQPPYQELAAWREAVGGTPLVELWYGNDADETCRACAPKTKVESAHRREAAAIAADIAARARAGALRFGGTAILLRTLGHLDILLDALRDEDVPFEVARDRSYYRRREVIELAALARAIVEPHDRLALVSALRASFVGVPDAALAPLLAGGFVERLARVEGAGSGEERKQLDLLHALIDEVGPRVDALAIPRLERLAGWPLVLHDFIENVARARRSLREDSPADFVEELRTLFAPEVSEAARYLAPFRLANLERLLEELRVSLEDPELSLFDLRRRLDVAVARGLEAEEARPPEAARDAVRVLTIHAAKGLEYEHVYLAQMSSELDPRGGRGDARSTRVRRRGGRTLVTLLGAPSVESALAGAEEGALEKAEQVRLLYVAMTRAKERLVLAGSPKGSVLEDPPKRWVDLLGRGLVECRDLSALLARIAGATPEADTPAALAAPLEARSGLLVRLLAFGEAAATPSRRASGSSAAGASSEGSSTPRIDALLAEAARLEAARAAARKRAGRPLGSAASAAAHERFAELVESELDEEGRAPSTTRPLGGERVALAAGSAVHRALELLDLARPAEALREAAARAGALLGPELSPDERAEASERVRRLLEALAASDLPARLAALQTRIVARELPFVAAPEVVFEASEGEEASTRPLGYVAGAIDLVYRDPADDALVVADFKTDHLPTGDEDALARRAEVYAPQLRAYAAALGRALGLASAPRAELWFLAAGRVVTLGGSERGAGEQSGPGPTGGSTP